MRVELQRILASLDEWIRLENLRRGTEDELILPKSLIQVYGQCGLLLNPLVDLPLAGTRDLDAGIKSLAHHGSTWPIQKKLEDLLEDVNMELESDVHLIWIPQGSTYSVILDTPQLRCEVLDPLYLLCSKAIKAKEKNRILVQKALEQYGECLRKLIEIHGGDCEYFEA